MTINKTGLIIVGLISLIALSFSVHSMLKVRKTGWIVIGNVYENFQYKKELESKLMSTKLGRKNIIDSMEFDLKLLANQIELEKGKDKSRIALFQAKREDYINKKKMFEEDNDMLVEKYDEQILNQLNQYVKDFAKEKGYDYIYAADGSGVIMAAPEDENVTELVKVFINEKYKGK